MTNPSPKKPIDADRQIGETIKKYRVAKGLSQGALGAALGVSWQQYSKYENGANRLSIGKFLIVAQTLEVPVEKLLNQTAPVIMDTEYRY
jgi:transcriptional regulator with XRE-family HTH domain